VHQVSKPSPENIPPRRHRQAQSTANSHPVSPSVAQQQVQLGEPRSRDAYGIGEHNGRMAHQMGNSQVKVQKQVQKTGGRQSQTHKAQGHKAQEQMRGAHQRVVLSRNVHRSPGRVGSRQSLKRFYRSLRFAIAGALVGGLLTTATVYLSYSLVAGFQRLVPGKNTGTSEPASQSGQPPLASPVAVAPKPRNWEEMVYNLRQSPPLVHNPDLQAIVDQAVSLAKNKQLDTAPLSMTLIDVKSNQSAGFQNQQLRYPASVAKLFWMIFFEAQLEAGFLSPDGEAQSDLKEMIVNSDNDAASRIVDRISHTNPDAEQEKDDMVTWQKKRLQISQFFRGAGYEGLSISQKNYPIGSLGLEEPGGREAEMQDENKQPIHSLMSSDHAARMMYEIYQKQAVSAGRSQDMLALLKRDLNPTVWQANSENAIAGFLGELLPADVQFFSKVGMTGDVRHEVALIESSDGKVAYVLAVMGANPAYSQDAKFFPELSKTVFTRMMERGAKAVNQPEQKPDTK
jgi:beta-lactamase class A